MPENTGNMEAITNRKKDNTVLYIVYATAAYFGLQFLMKPKRAAAATISTPIPIPVTVPSANSGYGPDVSEASKWVAESFPLRKGMKGNNVKRLQQHLGIAADGAFGDHTETALLQRYGVSTLSQAQFRMFTGKVSGTRTVVSTTNAASVKWIAESFPLRYGMKGNQIKILQQKLGVPADGAFGINTQSALLLKYGATTVSPVLFRTITQTVPTAVPAIPDRALPKANTSDHLVTLKRGSRGNDVYRLQKWLGFKDKRAAKKGDWIADGIFGNQTGSALQKRTGKSSITLSELKSLSKQVAGIGYLGEILVTRRSATVLDNRLRPCYNIGGNTILGTRTMELSDPVKRKSYTQFQSVDGIRRWVESDAL